jgi:thiamine biosynthesis lipoprotein
MPAGLCLLGRRVQLPSGTVLDLRATTDAAVAELAARAVAQRLGVGAVVGIGGDVAQAGPAPAGGWPLVLPDGAIVRLPAGRAAATMRADRPGLILDPHTCAAVPAAWACLTVVDRDPLRAKATALAAAVLGPDGDAYLRLRGARYRLVGLDGAERRSAGWPTDVRSVPAPRSGSLAS